MTSRRPTALVLTSLLLTFGPALGPAAALEPPEGASAAEQIAYDDPGMYILNYYQPLDSMPDSLRQTLSLELSVLGVPPNAGFYDLRADRWGSLITTYPLIPGGGAGNALTWADLGVAPPGDEAQLGEAAWEAFQGFLGNFAGELRIDAAELGTPEITVHEGGRLVQINARRVVGGTPVVGSWIHAVINSGNLVLYGTRNWGDVDISTAPQVTKTQAVAAVEDYVASVPHQATLRGPVLQIHPMQNGDKPSQENLGTGFDYRLSWEIQVDFDDDHGTWRALVDAQSGEVYSFGDQNKYATRDVIGGVQPVSNDELAPGGVPDGVEQAGWPMPFADIFIDRPLGGVPDTFTNSSGVLQCVEGEIRTRLAGRYARMNDNCGATDELASDPGNLDLGTSGGTDCTVPAGSNSAGNTHSSRDGFYEINRIVEQAQSWQPGNLWLQDQLTANMNINNECNAFWNGSTINFYRDSTGNKNDGIGCRNTGESAAVFDHEWGHGLDDNDALPEVSFPGETYADQAAMLRLNTSCIGRGFFKSGTCNGCGDSCTECTGVREVDFDKTASGRPHNVTWIKQPTFTPVDGPLAPRGGCVGCAVAIPVLQTGPCNQLTHCEGIVVSEAVWDLMHRDLAGFEGSLFDLDANTRLNLVTRLYYLGATNVNFWFQCVDTPEDGTAGCNADGGYLNFLAVDDDNGNLLDGTPHISAINSAFARHQLACPAPLPLDSGCATPLAAPAVTVEPLDSGARVSWAAVPGATEYWVFKGDGQQQCEFGKERIAITSELSIVDGTLLNGREYYYTVEAVGSSDSCRSDASACQSVTPQAAGTPQEGNLQIAVGSEVVDILSGDGDPFFDNCETAELSFEVVNVGGETLTNVRIESVESPSHPSIQVTTPLPIDLAASLTDCAPAPASLRIVASGLAFNDTLTLEIGLTADELAGVVRTQTIEIKNTESSFVFTPTHTFAFNGLDDLEGWERVIGSFDQTPGGPPADAAGFFLRSSAFIPDQCDAIQSPLVRLSGTSTLSLYNQYDTEPPLPVFGGTFYDRANVGILDAATGVRTAIVPDGGRPYDIPAGQEANGSCFTNGERGWAEAGQLTWEESTWSSGALLAAAATGVPVRLHVAYGTDPLVQGAGFQFDLVTLTDFDMQGPDQESDLCVGLPPEAVDDSAETTFETSVIIDVVSNDLENGGGPLAINAVQNPTDEGGTATDNGGGTVEYTPPGGFVGSDTFSYEICNGNGCGTGTVTVEVSCPVTPTGSFSDDFEPMAEAGWMVDTAANNIPTSTTWMVVADAFAESPTNSFFTDATSLDLKDDRLIAPPVDLSPTSRLVFWHRFNFETTFDGGVLEVSTDGGASWADVGAGSFITGGYNGTIDPGFDSPIAGRAAWTGFSDFVNAMNMVEVDLGAFAGDGVLVRWRAALDPLVPGSVPGAGWWVDDVQFTNLNERAASCNAPIARPDAAVTNKNTSVLIDVVDNDSDGGSPPLTVTTVQSPTDQGGTATNNNDGTVTYEPPTDFVSPPNDTFTYQVCNNDNLCDSTTVTVQVVNDGNLGPNARDDTDTTLKDTPVAIDVLANDDDPNGDPITIVDVQSPTDQGGTAVIDDNSTPGDPKDDFIVYTPPAGFVSPPDDSFAYQICDPEPLCDTARVAVTVFDDNQPPDARDDFATTLEDTPVSIPVLDNDEDPDGDPFSIFSVTAPSNGSAVVDNQGTADPSDDEIVYTPDPGFTGEDMFTYTICDPGPECDTATVTVRVDPDDGDGRKVTGGGWIPEQGGNGQANFGFNAHGDKTPPKGRLSYHFTAGGDIHLKGTVTEVQVFSDTQAEFSGPCQLDGDTNCRYTVFVEDNGEPGAGVDSFGILVEDLLGNPLHEAGDVLGGGNIQIH